ncbi:MAG: MFS transporter [Deltaproteobacteria bacterium]|nr:MFS transporter [Deltaproteobacteria bacterium]
MSDEAASGASTAEAPAQQAANPVREIVQPFIDLARAPRALWGVNISYLIEGFVYFGMLGYLAMYFNEYVWLNDVWADWMVMLLTGGITFSMFLFGGLADRWGVRVAFILALFSMIIGRVFLAGGPMLGLPDYGLWSSVHLVAALGILFIVLGFGMYQPAAYAAARQFTSEKTSAMAYAMLYAVMNLGGWLPSFFSPVRKAVGIAGAFWVYVAFSLLGLLLTVLILSRRTVEEATARAKAERELEQKAKGDKPAAKKEEKEEAKSTEPFSVLRWLKNHPLADVKFSFFIFCLIPVQTLFAHNWLTLPQYVERAHSGTWIGTNFEVAVNFNPLLIFILAPFVAAVTRKTKMYKMMIVGTLIMAAPTFLLALGPSFETLLAYLVLMTIGEAIWQPRFLQYAAEIAPEGRTGAYMGVAQFPWFLTKVITGLYAGWFLQRYCPQNAPPESLQTETMWLIYGAIAISSSLMLILARNWLGRDFKSKAA